MGLLIKLQNGDTALKSLKFGKDRLGGGDSGQPYIQNPIIDEPGKLSQADNDFLLRGGLRAPINAAEDVARLTKYMFNLKNPSGLLFIAKQNLLSRVAVATEASQKWGINTPGAGYAAGALNAGVYTPLSTLLQAGIGFTGTHLNMMGINPFSPMTGVIENSFFPGLGLKRYEDIVKEKNSAEFNNLTTNFPIGAVEVTNIIAKTPLIPGLPPFAQTNLPPAPPPRNINIGIFYNRLLDLWYNKNFNTNNDTTILQYGGGPGSILGIGKTRINFADNQRTGVNNPLFITNKKYFLKGGKTTPTQYIIVDKEGNYTFTPTLNYNNLLGASIKERLTPFELGINEEGQISTLYSPEIPYTTLSKYNPTAQNLSGSKGYQAQLKLTQIQNLNSLLGASKKENLTEMLPGDELFPKYVSYGISYNPTLSKDSFGLTLSGSGGYQIGKQNHFTEISDTTYKSQIQDKLIEYGIEEIPPLAFDLGNVSGDARTWAPTTDGTKFIPKYSSGPTLKINPDVTETDDKNIAEQLNASFEEGYLANLNPNKKQPTTRIGKISNDFRQVNRKKRGFNDPNSTYDYIAPKDGQFTDYSGSKTVDKIYYDTSAIKRTSNSLGTTNDLFNFKISIFDVPSFSSEDLNFRAYIDNFSDSYTAEWKSQTYMGRAEKQYKYNAFDRSISLGFTIVADNPTNLKKMYEQLNLLASSLAPSYTSKGYMTGNLHRLTVGDYVANQWGIIEGLSFEVMDESPYEITPGSQLPLYIKVNGIKFTPIHNFRPEYKKPGPDSSPYKFVDQDSTTNDPLS